MWSFDQFDEAVAAPLWDLVPQEHAAALDVSDALATTDDWDLVLDDRSGRSNPFLGSVIGIDRFLAGDLEAAGPVPEWINGPTHTAHHRSDRDNLAALFGANTTSFDRLDVLVDEIAAWPDGASGIVLVQAPYGRNRPLHVMRRDNETVVTSPDPMVTGGPEILAAAFDGCDRAMDAAGLAETAAMIGTRTTAAVVRTDHGFVRDAAERMCGTPTERDARQHALDVARPEIVRDTVDSCVNTAIAYDVSFTGAPSVALQQVDTRSERPTLVPGDLKALAVPGEVSRPTALADVAGRMTSPGERGTFSMSAPVRHVLNVVNIDGVPVFVDATVGRVGPADMVLRGVEEFAQDHRPVMALQLLDAADRGELLGSTSLLRTTPGLDPARMIARAQVLEDVVGRLLSGHMEATAEGAARALLAGGRVGGVASERSQTYTCEAREVAALTLAGGPGTMYRVTFADLDASPMLFCNVDGVPVAIDVESAHVSPSLPAGHVEMTQLARGQSVRRRFTRGADVRFER